MIQLQKTSKAQQALADWKNFGQGMANFQIPTQMFNAAKNGAVEGLDNVYGITKSIYVMTFAQPSGAEAQVAFDTINQSLIRYLEISLGLGGLAWTSRKFYTVASPIGNRFVQFGLNTTWPIRGGVYDASYFWNAPMMYPIEGIKNLFRLARGFWQTKIVKPLTTTRIVIVSSQPAASPKANANPRIGNPSPQPPPSRPNTDQIEAEMRRLVSQIDGLDRDVTKQREQIDFLKGKLRTFSYTTYSEKEADQDDLERKERYLTATRNDRDSLRREHERLSMKLN